MSIQPLIRNTFYRLFPPLEVRVVADRLNSFLSSQDNWLKADVEKSLVKFIQGRPEQVQYSMRIERRDPTEIALLLVRNRLEDELCSGWNHVYRGLLSQRGELLFKLWEAAGNELWKKGFFEKELILKENKCVLEAVKAVG